MTLTLSSTAVPANSILAAPANTVATVIINDTSKAPVNLLTPSATTVGEGGTVTFNLTNAIDGNYTYTITNGGGVSATDLKGGLPTDTPLKVQKGVASIPVSVLADATTEGLETLILTVSGVASGATSAITGANALVSRVIINDTSVAPTNDLLPSSATANEGNATAFNLFNFAPGTYTYELTGTSLGNELTIGAGATAGTYSSPKFSGTVVVGTNGQASLPVTFLADHSTEGAEVFTLELKNSSSVSQATSSILVNDSSPAYSYTVTPSAKTVNEGKSVNFTVSNAKADDVLTYAITGSVDTADLTDSTFTDASGSLSGAATVGKNGSVVIPVYIRADGAYDASGKATAETLTFTVTDGASLSITAVGVVTVNDTSIA